MAGDTRAASPHFVGRLEELSRAEALLDTARSGGAPTLVVAGEAGIGKTRFVDELVRRAGDVDASVLRGGCVDLGDDVLPYAPFVGMLRDLTRREGAGLCSSSPALRRRNCAGLHRSSRSMVTSPNPRGRARAVSTRR